MTPEQKAKKLVNKFKDYVLIDYRGDEEPLLEYQQRCALIVCDEVISELKQELKPYWNEVKKEIKKL